jgi:hypothetical protein
MSLDVTFAHVYDTLQVTNVTYMASHITRLKLSEMSNYKGINVTLNEEYKMLANSISNKSLLKCY